MRPERLELDGFMAYRDPTVVDLRDVDLFAVTGPTGAGKSSLVDAICFALFGNVPRLGKKPTEPVISQGRTGARLRLDFSIEEERFTLVRVVRRNPRGGATNKEVRLERADGGEVLAANARELDEAVEDLLGLSYEHFTTCVVLPQGEFARFLHEEPAKRRQLLTELLELGYLEHLRKAAHSRAQLAQLDRNQREQELAGVERWANDDQLRKVEEEHDVLGRLLEALDGAAADLDAVRAATDEAERAVRATADALGALESVTAPAGLERIGDVARHAREQVAQARANEEATASRLAESEAALEALPDRTGVAVGLERHREATRLRERLVVGDTAVRDARDEAATAATAVAAAQRSLERANEVYEAACRADRAGEFAASLVVGEPCPVCGQEVHELPAHRSGDVALADRTRGEAEKVLADARTDAEEADRRLRVAEAKHEELASRLTELDELLADTPDLESLAATEAAIAAATQVVTEHKTTLRRLTAARAQAEDTAAAAEAQEEGARRALTEAREAVASLRPPALGHDDVVADWHALVAWAQGEREAQREAQKAAQARAEAARTRRGSLLAQLRDLAAAAGLAIDDDADAAAMRDECQQALGKTRDELQGIRDGMVRAAALRDEIDAVREREVVAGELDRHLRSDRFVQWVLDDVLRRLAVGASALLHDLSSGAYSLRVGADRDSFEVVDHANADTARSVRTLSGGETFLASLALALAMADQVRELAASGAARLEALFLDEGFGTLDPDTLDTVAATLETLKAQGRMVGVITHVDDLAARLPARFEVRKGPATATVERVL